MTDALQGQFLDPAPAALTSGQMGRLAINSARQLVVAVDGSTSTVNRVARAVHLASAALPAAGAWTAQTAYAVPVGVKAVSFICTYTRGMANGQALHRVVAGNGTETADVLLVDPVIVVAQPFGTQSAYRQVIGGPIPADASAITYELTIPITGGWTTLALLSAEADATKAAPGTLAIALTAGY